MSLVSADGFGYQFWKSRWSNRPSHSAICTGWVKPSACSTRRWSGAGCPDRVIEACSTVSRQPPAEAVSVLVRGPRSPAMPATTMRTTIARPVRCARRPRKPRGASTRSSVVESVRATTRR